MHVPDHNVIYAAILGIYSDNTDSHRHRIQTSQESRCRRSKYSTNQLILDISEHKMSDFFVYCSINDVLSPVLARWNRGKRETNRNRTFRPQSSCMFYYLQQTKKNCIELYISVRYSVRISELTCLSLAGDSSKLICSSFRARSRCPFMNQVCTTKPVANGR